MSQTGRSALTFRELDVPAGLAEGKTNKEIAAKLGISPGTVRKHVEHIFAKLGITTRSAAAAYAAKNGVRARGPLSKGVSQQSSS